MPTQSVAEWLNQKSPAGRREAILGTVQWEVKKGNPKKARKLLTDFTFIEAKLDDFDLENLVADYELAKPLFKSKALSLIQGALRNASSVLNEDKSELAAQLWGHLIGKQEISRIQKLLSQTYQKEDPWFRPLTAALTPPESPLRRILRAHSRVTSSAVLPDNRHVILGHSDGDLLVWDMETGRNTMRIVGHTEKVSDVAVTADGFFAASSSDDGTVRVWDLETGGQIHCLQIPAQDTPALRESNRQLNAGNTANCVVIYPYVTTNYVVAGYNDGTIKGWNLKSGELALIEFVQEDAWVQRLVIEPEEEWTFFAGLRATADARIRMDEVCTVIAVKLKIVEREVESYPLSFCEINIDGLAVTPNGEHLIGVGGAIRIQNYEKGKQNTYSKIDDCEIARSVAASPNSRLISIGFDNGSIFLFDPKTRQSITTLEGHSASVQTLAFSQDGKKLVSGALDRTARVWNVEAATQDASSSSAQSARAHAHIVQSLAVTPDGKEAISASRDEIIIWDIKTLQSKQKLQYRSPGGDGGATVETVFASTDNRRFIVGASDNLFSVWSRRTGKSLYSSIALEKDYIGTIRAGGKMKYNHDNAVTALAETSDGQRLVTASSDGQLKLWLIKKEMPLFGQPGDETIRYEHVRTFRSHGRELVGIRDIAITPDNRRVVSADSETIIVWDIKSDKRILVIKDTAYCLAISKDGRYLLAGGALNVHMWNIITGDLVARLDAGKNGHQGIVSRVFLLPDQQQVVSIGRDMTIKLWDLATTSIVASYTCEGSIHSAAVAPDGKTILLGDQLGIVHFVRLEGGSFARCNR